MEGVDMALGLMNKKIYISALENTTDQDGFTNQQFKRLKETRAIVEEKYLNEKWSNYAAFADAEILFQLRAIPNFTVELEHYVEYQGLVYNIINVENVKGRNMYIEILAKRCDASYGKL